MNKISCFILLVSCHVRGAEIIANNENEVEGYYWRDYAGAIPKDALPGGQNSNGKTTYIGQVLFREQLIPAKIDPEVNKVNFEWGYTEYEATSNIKILCTQHPEQFVWLESAHGIFDQVKDKNLVPGGHEEGAMLFIGRKALEIGKIISTKKQTTLNTVENGKGIQHAAFSVLSYDPTKEMKKKNKCNSTLVAPMDTEQVATAECKQNEIIVNVFNC